MLRPTDREKFFKTAEAISCVIGVREPNDSVFKWIGNPKCVPKSVAVKAKTADNPRYQAGRYAGLVVSPARAPNAFENPMAALDTWFKFARGDRLPFGFTCDTYGVLFDASGNRIHSDFDLMAVEAVDKDGNLASTSDAEAQRLSALVQDFVNRQYPVKMIQHGPEMEYADGIGGKKDELIEWFFPKGRYSQSRFIFDGGTPTPPNTFH